MGNALVIMVVPEESLPGASSHHSEEYVRYWLAEFRASAWEPPPEPRTGLRSAKARREHRARVRASLETFINERLRELDYMVRTGWWVLGSARVRVSIADAQLPPVRKHREAL